MDNKYFRYVEGYGINMILFLMKMIKNLLTIYYLIIEEDLTLIDELILILISIDPKLWYMYFFHNCLFEALLSSILGLLLL